MVKWIEVFKQNVVTQTGLSLQQRKFALTSRILYWRLLKVEPVKMVQNYHHFRTLSVMLGKGMSIC